MPRQDQTRNSSLSATLVGRVDRIVPGGLGLVRLADGVAFVPGALPGEEVAIERFRRRGGARHAESFRILSPSDERRTPDCALHPTCGGCDLLHFSEAARREALETMVHDALQRIAKLPDEELERVAPLRQDPGGEGRRRCRVVIDGEGRPGFFGRSSHHVVAVERCPALHPALEALLEALARTPDLTPGARLRLAVDEEGRRSAAVEGLEEGPAAALAQRLTEAGVVQGALVVDHESEVVAEVGDARLFGEVAPGDPGGPYTSDAATFTQATRFGGQAIADAVTGSLKELGFTEGYLLELFAGAGHLTFPLARLGPEVVAVEGAPRAVHWLRHNTDRSGLGERVRPLWAHIDGGRFGGPMLDQLESFPDVVVADPPRTGIPRFSGILDVIAPAVIVLVSCDLATGARDLAIARGYGYELQELVPLDCFPRTSHVEWVATLVER